jgi:hypothetical protein
LLCLLHFPSLLFLQRALLHSVYTYPIRYAHIHSRVWTSPTSYMSVLITFQENEHEASRRLKTEFMTQVDGATTSAEDRILIMAATNIPWELDEAVLRSVALTFPCPLLCLLLYSVLSCVEDCVRDAHARSRIGHATLLLLCTACTRILTYICTQHCTTPHYTLHPITSHHTTPRHTGA